MVQYSLSRTMSAAPRRTQAILPSGDLPGYLASCWIAGVALVILIVGGYGAAQPLLPGEDSAVAGLASGNEVLLEQFDPPSAAVAEEPPEAPPAPEPDQEIPPLPAITPPLKAPEMVELARLEEPPRAAPLRRQPRKPKLPLERRRPASSQTSSGEPAGGLQGESGAVTTFAGGGRGRFPSPAYPAIARANREAGTVRILVTVETTGLPSAVTVLSSSGSTTLDSAARDHISRRWRWPAGEVRRYIVPVRFVLQP